MGTEQVDTGVCLPPPMVSPHGSVCRKRKRGGHGDELVDKRAGTDKQEDEPFPKRGAVQWHERRSVWRGLGVVVGSVGGLAALHGVKPLLFDLFLRSLRFLSLTFSSSSSSSSLPSLSTLAPLARSGGAGGVVAWVWAVGGVAAVAAGAKMWARRCYADPEALEAYYADFRRQGFMASVDRHGFDNLLRIATREGMAIRLAEEMQSVPGFDELWHTYGGHFLSLFIAKQLLTREYLRAKFAWEFAYPEALDDRDERADLMKAMLKYGEWAVEWLEVSPAWLRHRFAHDQRVAGLSFSQLVREGGMALHPSTGPKLIGRVQLRQMFFRELNQHAWTFEQIKRLCKPWLFAHDPAEDEHDWAEDSEDETGEYVERSLVKPEELISVFNEEIARLELCELIDLYWQWPLSEYMRRLVPDEELASKLRQLHSRYEAVTKTYNNARRTVQAHFSKEKKVADDIYDTKVVAAERIYNAATEKHSAKMKDVKLRRKILKKKMKKRERSARNENQEKQVRGTKAEEDRRSKQETELMRLELAKSKAQQKLSAASERKTSVVEAATAERKLVVAMLERDRDGQLHVIDERLSVEKARLNQEWLALRQPQLHFYVPAFLVSADGPLMRVAEEVGHRPSAPPMEVLTEIAAASAGGNNSDGGFPSAPPLMEEEEIHSFH